MKKISDCIKIESGNVICREEEGKKICFQSEEYILVADVISMDNCVFRNEIGQKACDFLFLFDRNKQEYQVLKSKESKAFYVELKGIDLAGACEQLLNSIEKTTNEIKGFDINAIVVSSRKFVPRYDNNEYYREVKRLIRKNIQFELTPYIHNI